MSVAQPGSVGQIQQLVPHVRNAATDHNGTLKNESEETLQSVSHWCPLRISKFEGFIMRQQLSAQQKQYIKVLKSLLKASGARVSQAQLRDLMKTVVIHNPWFPKEGMLDVELWEQVGRNLKQHQA